MEGMKPIRLLALLSISLGIAAAQTEPISSVFNTALATEPAQASSTPLSYAIAHFPYGGGFSTRILVANSGKTDASVDIKFFNQAGAPTLVPLEGEQGLQGSQQFVLHPNDVHVVGADLSQRMDPLQVVWATASSSSALNIFSLFDFGSSATAISGAVGAQATLPAKTFRFPVSIGGSLGYNAGFAVANPHGSQTKVTVKVLNPDGSLKGSFDETLPANGQTIFTLTSKLGFDTSTLFNGSAAVCATQAVGLVTVGFEGGAFFSTSVTNDPCP
jgi:hypothetical protein